MQLGELQEHIAEFHKLGADLWAIDSTEPVGTIATYAQVRGFTFPLLADHALEVTKRYGALNVEQPQVAYPATLVIDRSGVVRYARVDVDTVDRPPVSDVLAAVKRLAK